MVLDDNGNFDDVYSRDLAMYMLDNLSVLYFSIFSLEYELNFYLTVGTFSFLKLEGKTAKWLTVKSALNNQAINYIDILRHLLFLLLLYFYNFFSLLFYFSYNLLIQLLLLFILFFT